VYDALIAQRPYKPPLSAPEAERIILEGREKHFDPVLTDLFRELAPQFALIAEHCNSTLKEGGVVPLAATA
jgi:HD-GYP domain-containing protein (c-di-GMP phosphodiesterase class II)